MSESKRMDNIDPTMAPRGAGPASSRFRVLQSLGAGGMGEVHLAEDSALRRKVAIKSIRTQLCQEPEVLKRIERECLLHAKIGSHPHIVTLYDRIEEDGRIKLIMEYVEGETLHSLIDRLTNEGNRLSLKEGITIAVQTLEALARIHTHKIVHRDIKPANIMICRDDCGEYCAKLMDFGIARAREEDGMTALTQTGMGGPGTPLYMAPEQIDPKTYGEISPATDVYAMGVMLYQIISGRPPFTGSITEIFNGHLNRSPMRLDAQSDPQVPSAFADIIDHALAKRPQDRYPSAHAFREALLDVDLSASAATFNRVTPPPAPTPGSAKTVSAGDVAAVVQSAAAGHTMLQRGAATRSSRATRAAAIAAIAFIGAIAVAGVAGYYVYNHWDSDKDPASTASAEDAAPSPAGIAPGATQNNDGTSNHLVPAVSVTPEPPATVGSVDVTSPTPQSSPDPAAPPPADAPVISPDTYVPPAPSAPASSTESSPADSPSRSAEDIFAEARQKALQENPELTANPEPAAPATVEPVPAVATAQPPVEPAPAEPAPPPAKPKASTPKSTPPKTAVTLVEDNPKPPAEPEPAPEPSIPAASGFTVKSKKVTQTK